MGDDDGFVMNLAGLDDGDHDGPSKKGNPRKRTVMKPERKGRHRGWAGKRADMVALAEDPFEVAPEALRDIEVRGTVLDGAPLDQPA